MLLPTPLFSDDPLTTCRKIVNWRLFLKFPDEIAVSPAAKDLITKLMCDVEERLGTIGVHEIKVGAGIGAPEGLSHMLSRCLCIQQHTHGVSN